MYQCKANVDFNIDFFVEEIERRYADWDPPIASFISKRGSTPFEILMSTMLSLRTKDKITAYASERLLKLASDPESVLALGFDEIKRLIYPVGFYRVKAARIMEISRIILKKHFGRVPSSMSDLLALPGVGRKTANLVLSEGFGIPSICVDTHVHRISNRIGYVHTDRPCHTETVLRKQLPKKYWSCYNKLLVAFGQTVCLPILPRCTTICSVSFICNRVGVERYK